VLYSAIIFLHKDTQNVFLIVCTFDILCLSNALSSRNDHAAVGLNTRVDTIWTMFSCRSRLHVESSFYSLSIDNDLTWSWKYSCVDRSCWPKPKYHFSRILISCIIMSCFFMSRCFIICTFMSRIFMPFTLVPHFHFSHFQSPRSRIHQSTIDQPTD